MKKTLIALAVITTSGIASAQSTVTLYGLLDAYVGFAKSGGLRQAGVNSGGIQTSRFGLKGSEDLGGGLKANFALESGFNIDTGVVSSYTNPFTGVSSASTFSRNSWVGFSGGFGEIKIGKMWTPYDDLNGSGSAAFNANVFKPDAYVWASNSYQDRPGNAVYYSTPSFGGFSGAAMYSFGENKTATTGAGRIASFNVAYSGGPVYVGLGYQTEKASGAVANTTKFTQLNAAYDLGVAKLLAGYGHVKNAPGVPKTNEYQIGADFPVGSALTLSAGFAQSKDKGFPAATEVKRRGFGLGALYALSKRTNMYVGLNTSKTTQSRVADAKTEVLAVGVRHTF